MEQLAEITSSQPEHEAAARTNERREAPRTPACKTHCLTITSGQDFLVGLLVDYSPERLGAETFGPLAVDATVSVTATVQVDGAWRKCSGVARVAHSHPKGEGLYRVGLDFETSTWVDTDAPVSEVAA